MANKNPLVGIIMGSDSDLPVMFEAAEILENLGVPYEITVVSAHRTPDVLFSYGTKAASRGLKVIIAGAGGAAHLPGMIASLTSLPVIGVPVKTKSMDGLDSLLSIAQMPPGVPVATVAVNGAKNAGLLAAQILGTSDVKLQKKISEYKKKMNVKVKAKAKKLQAIGYKKSILALNFMSEGNFFNKLKLLTVAGLSALPGGIKDAPPSKTKITPSTVSKEAIVKESLTPENSFSYEEHSGETKQEYFLSREYLHNLRDTLRERVVEEIKDNMVNTGNTSVTIGSEMSVEHTKSMGTHTGFDHVLLAVGTHPIVDTLSYYEYVLKVADSMHLEVGSAFADSHPNSVAYALLRSGVYDEWKKKGEKWSKLADSIIEPARKATNWRFWRHDYEWTMTTWLELAKRGLDTTFYTYTASPEELDRTDNLDSLKNISGQ